VQVIVRYYKAMDATRLTYQYGRYEDEGEADPMPLSAVLCTIKLSPRTDQGYYKLEPADLIVLDTFVKRNLPQARSERPRPVRDSRAQNSEAVAGKGRMGTTEYVTMRGRRAT
jgi:hypothetical protein